MKVKSLAESLVKDTDKTKIRRESELRLIDK